MTIDKDKLIKLIDDNLDVVYNDNDMDDLVQLVNKIIKLFVPSTVKDKLYQGIIKRELKDKYEDDKYGTYCIQCGHYDTIENGILIHRHYRRCPTAQVERILEL